MRLRLFRCIFILLRAFEAIRCFFSIPVIVCAMDRCAFEVHWRLFKGSCCLLAFNLGGCV